MILELWSSLIETGASVECREQEQNKITLICDRYAWDDTALEEQYFGFDWKTSYTGEMIIIKCKISIYCTRRTTSCLSNNRNILRFFFRYSENVFCVHYHYLFGFNNETYATALCVATVFDFPIDMRPMKGKHVYLHNNSYYLCAVGQQVVHSHTLHNKKYVLVVRMRTTERFHFRMLAFFPPRPLSLSIQQVKLALKIATLVFFWFTRNVSCSPALCTVSKTHHSTLARIRLLLSLLLLDATCYPARGDICETLFINPKRSIYETELLYAICQIHTITIFYSFDFRRTCATCHFTWA